jgi:hypothetical protein
MSSDELSNASDVPEDREEQGSDLDDLFGDDGSDVAPSK